jgi:hypothetical protein
MAMTTEPVWVWWSLGVIAAAIVTALIAIMLIAWLARRANGRRRPPA